MKKALFGMFLVLVIVALLFVALVSCEDQETAFAITSNTSPSGLVVPNILPWCDYRDLVYNVDFPNEVGMYSTSNFARRSNPSYSSVANSCVNLSTTGEIWMVFDVPSLSTYSFSLSGYSNGYVGNAIGIYIYSISSETNERVRLYYTSQSTTSGNYQYTYTFTVSSPNTTRIHIRLLFQTVSSQSYLMNLKCILNGSYNVTGFSGFVVPEILSLYPESDPVLEYYDMGIVAPNLLNNSDLYEVPFYTGYVSGDDVYTESYLNGAGMQDIWYSSIASSSFTYNTTDKCVTFPLGFVGDALRYDYSSFDSPSVYTFSLAYVSPIDLMFSVTDDSYVSLFDEVIPSSASSPSVFTYTFDLIEYEGNSFSIFISSEVSDGVSMSIYYTKLEYGEHFTGYIYPDRDLSDVVRTNLLYDWTFEEVPDVDDFSKFNAWLIDSSDVVSTSLSPVGRFFESSTSSYVLSYRLPQDGFTQLANYTFALRAVTSKPLVIQTKASSTYTAGYWFLESPSPVDISFTFEYRNDTIIEILVEEGTEFSLYYAKLEYGSNFTGFCENNNILYDRGYNSGYSTGFLEGYSSYSASSYDLVFPADTLTLDVGWSDFGFSTVEECWAAAYKLDYLPYVDAGLPVVTRGFYKGITYENTTPPVAHPWGVVVYCSLIPIESEDIDNFYSTIILNIHEDYTLFINHDGEDNIPSDWLSYDFYRSVTLTVSRGIDIESLYNNQVYAQGYNEGYNTGYDNGFISGKNLGLSIGLDAYYNYVSDIGDSSWFSFFSAFIDVPVKVIVSLFDYDVFGLNLFSLIKALVLFELFFLTIRFLTKGKLQ